MSQQSDQQQNSPRDPTPRRWRLAERPAQFAYILVWVGVFVAAGFISVGANVLPFINTQARQAAESEPQAPPSPPPTLPSERGLALPAKVVGRQVRPSRDGEFPPTYWAGVNLGSSVPGKDPGQVAATRSDYDRWFTQMGELGVGVVRVYTILSPAFYDALRDYNLRHAARPLYVLHGIWIPEERWYATGNAWDPQVVRAMRSEIADAVAVVHGDAQIPYVRGHAAGVYRSDISPWMLGWSFGIEWDPASVIATNAKNAGRRARSPGTYIHTLPSASPMEQWIGEHLDLLAGEEARRGFSIPLTFTNWDTTDPLHHPSEPLFHEDAVSIDAMHLRATPAWPAGYFASFHAYPYYPDFNHLEAKYLNYRRSGDGVKDPYAGYIKDLVRHHTGIPLMITEVGQPTSLGCAHFGPLGRHQGCHSEQQAARNLREMVDIIEQEGGAGGIAFTWLDEWFKFTWNTIDYELPHDRRSMWRNPLTNEEHFGLIAAEPGRQSVVIVDGNDREWARVPSIASARGGPVQEVRATHDAENVYLRVRVTPELWTQQRIVIGLDAHRGGNDGLPGTRGADPDADVAVVITPDGPARIFHAAWNEALGMRYGGFANPTDRFVKARRADLQRGSGTWVPLRQLINYPVKIPATGETRTTEVRDASELPWGSHDPSDPDFDDRHLIMGRDDTLEIAIPWGMMTFADPSSHTVYEFRLVPDREKQTVPVPIDQLGISVAVGDGSTTLSTSGYRWKPWDEVEWHERPKAGWPILYDLYQRHYPSAATP